YVEFTGYTPSENFFKGNAYFEGAAPSFFQPGIHTFEVYTDGRNLQWQVKTPGCNSAFKSANGSNADPCANNLLTELQTSDAEASSDELSTSIFYPNPATDFVTLDIGAEPAAFSIQIYDEVGKLILSRDYPQNTYYEVPVDISALKPGMLYFVVKINGRETSAFRIIKK
ncbi:MAG: T9SS type A sorting domain-containing protein, partial [Flavobacteriaceae bacterium]|nr:T9SS type A sorting domain-containing protein [Eudoraea sp.]NNJ38287.1 T9SS type A sorting domain-containing protein [Flavobacteriaceae bacterium]